MDTKEFKKLLESYSLKKYAEYIKRDPATVYRRKKIPKIYKHLTIEFIELQNEKAIEFIELLNQFLFITYIKKWKRQKSSQQELSHYLCFERLLYDLVSFDLKQKIH